MKDEQPAFLPIAQPNIGSLEKELVVEAIESGWVSSVGPFVAQFESEFATFAGTDHAVSISNGTDSLFIALTALGIGPGDEVIIPALTFVAVASAVVRTGATPCFVDVDAENWCIDPLAVENAIGDQSRAIIAVHSYGHPADMIKLLEIGGRHGLFVIEDCAEAHGAKVGGTTVGSMGDVGCFSFYGNKIITTGEGGMITTKDHSLSDRCRYLKDHAMDAGRPYYHSELGYNCRMTNLQAALGCAQLRRIPEFLERRRNLLSWYQEAFGTVDWVQLNQQSEWASAVVWIVCAVFPNKSEEWRDDLMRSMRAKNIDSRPFFYPLCDLPPYRTCRRVGTAGDETPEAHRLAASGVNLPTSIEMTRDDVNRVVSAIANFADNA